MFICHSTTGRVLKFVGDYSTNDFHQWASVQNQGYVGNGLWYGNTEYPYTYSATVVDDAQKGCKAARFEVRSGDVPGFGGGERSQVGSTAAQTGATEGQTRWYELHTKFDVDFPQNHATLGWGVTSGWHPDSDLGSGPFQLSVEDHDGYWTLYLQPQSSPGVYLGSFGVWETPLDVGNWHDVVIQAHFSTSDSLGWIRLWHNGVRQSFTAGAVGSRSADNKTYYIRTIVPTTTTVYYKEGYYRTPIAPTGIIYFTGFKCYSNE